LQNIKGKNNIKKTMEKYLFSCLKYFIVGIMAFLAPIYYALIFVCVLVITDTITGVMKAGKKKVLDIKSKKFFAFVPKASIYLLFVILAQFGTLVLDKSIPFVKLAVFGVSWIEIKSIDENFRSIWGFSFLDKVLESVKYISNLRK
jgi:phage-related holin